MAAVVSVLPSSTTMISNGRLPLSSTVPQPAHLIEPARRVVGRDHDGDGVGGLVMAALVASDNP